MLPPPQLEFDHTVGFEKIPFTDILGPSTGTTRYFGWHVAEINHYVLVTRWTILSARLISFLIVGFTVEAL